MTSTPNSVSAPTGPSEVVAIHCKWDFCAETFVSFAEWETHFAVEHVAHARPVNLTGRKQRLREDGYWELVDEEAGPREHLPLHQIPSQTTGDITTTTHTLSYPLPPSFQPIDSSMISSYPADASHLPLHPLTPESVFHPHTPAAYEEERARLQAAAREAENERLYRTFLRSPSLSPVQSGSASGSGPNSYQPPPPGQRRQSPSWSFTQSQPPSQLFTTPPRQPDSTSGNSDRSPRSSARLEDSSVELTRSVESSSGSPGFRSFFPSNPTHSHRDDSSQSSPNNAPRTSQTVVVHKIQSASNLRFGSALGHADKASPRAGQERHIPASSTAVGFSWGSG